MVLATVVEMNSEIPAAAAVVSISPFRVPLICSQQSWVVVLAVQFWIPSMAP